MGAYQYKYGDQPLKGYTIQRAVGRGGFGEVYYAISGSGRQVALKAIQSHEHIELRGIRECMNLKSPHLVTIFDVQYNDKGRPFVVMEYVSGPLLSDLLKESPGGLGIQKAAFFLQEIGKALSFLHDCDIVHRDLKPGNVFYENSYVKIGDYGLAKSISSSSHTSQQIPVGTPSYMAPEVWDGQYNRTTDIYALGVVLYEMLTGQVPFLGASPVEILLKHMTVAPDMTHIEEPFARVVRKALAKDPTARYQIVREMLEDVFEVEHMRNSVSQFAPDELSIVAGHIAPKFCERVKAAHLCLCDDLVGEAETLYASLEDLAHGSREAQYRQRCAVRELGLPVETRTRNAGIVFRLIPAGSFLMGSPSTEGQRHSDETEHQVMLTQAFYCGKFEVTQGQWQHVMGRNPSYFESAGIDAPVENVSWEDCQAFVRRLCRTEGVPDGTYRLLTEAEWEYACRAGTKTAFCYGSALDSATANFNVEYPCENGSKSRGRRRTMTVGSFRPNAWGLYDMHGNVWEWCQDWYGDYPAASVTDPLGPASGDYRVYRGGSWLIYAWNCRSAVRSSHAPGFHYRYVGLRLARAVPSTRA